MQFDEIIEETFTNKESIKLYQLVLWDFLIINIIYINYYYYIL